jgi:hypothetical protein
VKGRFGFRRRGQWPGRGGGHERHEQEERRLRRDRHERAAQSAEAGQNGIGSGPSPWGKAQAPPLRPRAQGQDEHGRIRADACDQQSRRGDTPERARCRGHDREP